MRVKTKARDLKVGDTAFLPYFGKLMKSKIDGVSAVWSSKSGSGERVNVHYEVLSEPLPRHGNMCCMDVNSVYEVYLRRS
jgi:hypothetical protein